MHFIPKFLTKRRGGLENSIRMTTLARIAGMALGIVADSLSPPTMAQEPIPAGYRDFNYGSSVIAIPTADKPQSKLWWNDGNWWGVLWNLSARKYRIHRFNLTAQSWVDAGPNVDDRPQSLADVLWDGQKLYIASHVYSGGSQTSGNASAANSARLYRYSYNAVMATYSLDTGFPVLINSAICEALVIDKDSLGRLWVTWTQSSKVYLNHSLNDDLTWRTPFALPTQGSELDSDDISTLMAYDGKIGVVWSNQNDNRIYFSFHNDNKADTDWEPQESALADPSLGAVADDHVNMKIMNDGGGNLYVTTKTSLIGSSDPSIYLLKRSFGGGWAKYVVATKADNYTRPIVVIDDENRELYVFGKSGSNVYTKKTSLDNINFPSGAGDPFIRSSDADINDATVSKHNVNGTTGLLVLASDEINRYYYHNYIALPSNGLATISSFSPAQGPAGTLVTITGANFNGVSSVEFNGTVATSFTISSSTRITATVPVGATTGKISITKTTGTALSDNDFIVTAPTQYTLTVNAAGEGNVTLNPTGGLYNTGTMVTLTATPDAGYQFSGWSGDLAGSTNPATIAMNADKNITATFAPSHVGGGRRVAFEESKTGGSNRSTIVKTWANLTGVSGHLYLAAISTKDKVAVTGVSGLGLSWTLVKAQCTGRDNIGVEVWMAQGIPQGGSNGAVTATLAARPSNAVIVVSRYSGVDAVNPLGNIFSGNTNGVNGACSGGKDNRAYSFNLATMANGAMVYGAAAMRDRSHTPGTGYIERAEIKRGSASVAVQDKSFTEAGTAILNGMFNGNADWAVVGLEIKPQLHVSQTAVDVMANSPQPANFQLEQNYPNPFSQIPRFAGNPGTSIRYSLPQAGEVRMTIYNIYGQTVSIPMNGFQNAGTYIFDWQAVDVQGHPLPSGVYFYRLEAGSYSVTRRMTLLR
ncbi:MAG: InlB B-repeat-containing protein [bacterium]